ncbi:MAG: Type pilus assembly protein PilM [Candidatus Parcubacteria bacterium]|jgi:cell division ATPase FtsA
MSLFSFKESAERIGAVIDIGSASVLVSLVSSIPNQPHPRIIWSHREHAPLRNIDSLDQSSKAVMTALMNALLKLDVEGRRALRDYKSGLKVTEAQFTISAPWSYTVSKTINYAQEEPYEVSNELIEELLRAAVQKIREDLGDSESVNELGLTVITRATMDLLTNGYRVKYPIGQEAKELSISHASVVTQQYLVEHIDDLQNKIFPGTECKKTSYMLAFYCVAQDLYPDTFDTCLVHISYEATEIGIVRDGTLRYSTHTPFGSFSLAREIANITGVPLYEAFQYLHDDNPHDFIENLSESRRNEIEQVFEAYTARVADLFRQTGDELSIPKSVLLHADLKSEKFFKDITDKAARRTLKSDPLIKLVSPNLFDIMTHGEQANKPEALTDTAMLVSAQFFHKGDHLRFFEYL